MGLGNDEGKQKFVESYNEKMSWVGFRSFHITVIMTITVILASYMKTVRI